MPYKNPEDYNRYHRERYRNNAQKKAEKVLSERKQKFLEKFPDYQQQTKKLPADERTALLGYYLEGKSLRELADALDITRQGAQYKRDRGLKKLN